MAPRSAAYRQGSIQRNWEWTARIEPAESTRGISTAVCKRTRYSSEDIVDPSERRHWSVRLEVPSFRNVAALSPETQSFLRRTRCRLNGAEDFKPAGWLLSGNRKGALKSWPDSGKSLIQFEQSHEQIDNILETECRLSPGPVWLFRISSDGTARELAGHIVRPGYQYIVVTTGALPKLHPSLSPCRMNVHQYSKPFDYNTFRSIHGGYSMAQATRFPGGADGPGLACRAPGRSWDGEGSSEWLTTEEPCFGMVHDHPVDAYLLCLNGGAVMEIEAGELGTSCFRSAHAASGWQTHSYSQGPAYLYVGCCSVYARCRWVR